MLIVNRLSGHATAISDKEDIEKARELYDSMLDIERERSTASTYHTFLKKEKELKESALQAWIRQNRSVR